MAAGLIAFPGLPDPTDDQPVLTIGPCDRDATRSTVQVVDRGKTFEFVLDVTPRSILGLLHSQLDRYGGEE